MVSTALKPAVTRVIAPIARGAVRLGITPNAVTLIGTLLTATSALYFYPRGDLFIGTLFITVFTLADLFDGAIARLSDNGASAWGGFLDSTCDRLTDAAILAGVTIYCIRNDLAIYPAVVAVIVLGFLIPYIRAKAESFGIECSVGIAERTERLIIVLVAIGFHGLGVPYILAIGIWLLIAVSLVTIAQRTIVIWRGLR